MRHRLAMRATLAVAVFAVVAGAAWADLTFTDPKGDDDGPGGYVYPTDSVYVPGSFDLTGMTVETKGNKVNFDVTVAARLEDPWRMGVGFSVQMIFIFIDTDGKSGSGFTEGLPGTNVTFAPDSAWDRVVILSPQSSGRVKSEVESKVSPEMAKAVVVPSRVKGFGQTISASVKLDELGGGDPATWGYQVLMQSNEGFPKGGDLLTRKVNEFEGQHRFGGGTDYDCDPHVMDVFAGNAEGADSEVQAQHDMLSYECDAEGNSKKMAVLKMVRR